MIRVDRLRTLAAHIRNPDTFNDTHGFDFGSYVGRLYPNGEQMYSVPPCGTTACACGEMPTVWPDEWEIRKGLPRRIVDEHATDVVVHPFRPEAHETCEWFGINLHMFDHLFHPASQSTDNYGWDASAFSDGISRDLDDNPYIDIDASAETVATLIEQFCDWVEKGELS